MKRPAAARKKPASMKRPAAARKKPAMANRSAAARKKPAVAKRPAAAGEDGRPESRRSLELGMYLRGARLEMAMHLQQVMNSMAIPVNSFPAGVRPAREIPREVAGDSDHAGDRFGGETGDSISGPSSNVPTATGGSAVAAATTRNVNLECVHRSVLNVKSESEADPCETLSMPEADTHCEVK